MPLLLFKLPGLQVGVWPSETERFLTAELRARSAGRGLPAITANGIPTAVSAPHSSAADATPALTRDSATWRARGAAAAAAGDSRANVATTTQHATLTCKRNILT